MHLRTTSPALLGAAVVALGAGLSGCSAVTADGPEQAAKGFAAAVSADPTGACAHLAPRTREELEADGDACPQVLQRAELPAGGNVVRTTVAGHSAQVVMEHDTLFLALFDGGWKVTAAGCQREEPDDDRVPYDCAVKG